MDILCAKRWCESKDKYLFVLVFILKTVVDNAPSLWCVIAVSRKDNFPSDSISV